MRTAYTEIQVAAHKIDELVKEQRCKTDLRTAARLLATIRRAAKRSGDYRQVASFWVGTHIVVGSIDIWTTAIWENLKHFVARDYHDLYDENIEYGCMDIHLWAAAKMGKELQNG